MWAVVAVLTAAVAVGALPPHAWPQRGVTITNGKYCDVKYDDERAWHALRRIAAVGASHVTVVVTKFLKDENSTGPITATAATASASELTVVVKRAHALGLKVMLKPHIDLYASPKSWRGDVGRHWGDTGAKWSAFFRNYEDFIVAYAKFAAVHGVEQFSIGCELIHTHKQATHWRHVARAVRGVFRGAVTYAANWGGSETNSTWFDALDFIGVDAYYAMKQHKPTLQERLEHWRKVVEEGVADGVGDGYMSRSLAAVVEQYQLPLVFTEVGYCAGDCFNSSRVDVDAQRTAYVALLTAMSKYDWFHGLHLWNWPTDANFGSPTNSCMTPARKPAEEYLREQWRGHRPPPDPVPLPPAQCTCVE